jgi:hypothetical protein
MDMKDKKVATGDIVARIEQKKHGQLAGLVLLLYIYHILISLR